MSRSKTKLPEKYIVERLSGANKQESALLAGYSKETARVPSMIEATQRYATLVTQILTQTTEIVTQIQQDFATEYKKEPKDWHKLYLMTQVAEKQTKIYDTLTPRVTVKQTTDAKGNVTRHVWGSNSTQVNESLRDDA